MYDPFASVEPDEIPVGRVDRLRWIYAVSPTRGGAVIGLDADRDELVRLRLPGFPDDPDGDLSLILTGLRPDGRQVSIASDVHSALGPGIGTYTFSADQARWHRLAPHATCSPTAFSPDGQMLAVLAAQDDPDRIDPLNDRPDNLMTVHLIDPATGADRPIWSVPGGQPIESKIAWSPDQRHLAATYLREDDDGDEDFETVILTVDGAIVCRFDGMTLPSRTHGPWVNNRQLFCGFYDNPPIVVGDLDGTWQDPAHTEHRDHNDFWSTTIVGDSRCFLTHDFNHSQERRLLTLPKRISTGGVAFAADLT